MPQQWIANPRTPRPCPRPYELIRQEAVRRWGEDLVSSETLLEWARDGCPDARKVLLNAATRRPAIPGQAQDDPEKFVERLIEASVFLPEKAGLATVS